MIAIVIATIAAGIPISTVSANRLDFTDPFFLITWCLLGIFLAFCTFLYFNLSLKEIIGTFTMGYMLAVILRFVADLVISNMAHSNLSFTLILAMVVGAFCGWAGAGLWTLIKRARRNR